MIFRIGGLLVIMAGLIVGGVAWADETGKPDGQPREWSFMAGAGVAYSPDYEGSDDFNVNGLPLFDVTWRDRVSIGTTGGPGLKVKLLNIKGPTPGDRLTVTTSLGYFFGRDQDDNDALGGLGDLDGGATVGIGAKYSIRGFSAALGFQRDVSGDREGMIVRGDLGYTLALGASKRTMLSFGPNLTWADDEYMANIFGISATQAAASTRGFSAFSAGSGLKDVGVGMTLRHGWTRNVGLLARVNYKKLMGDAADSPIVERDGDENQFSLLAGITYRW